MLTSLNEKNSHIRRLCVAIFLVVFWLAMTNAVTAKNKKSVVYPPLPFVTDFGGHYSLIDTSGNIVTDKDFLGRFVILYFGYTNCADICPLAMDTISTALQNMGNLGERVTPLFINLDASLKSVTDLKQYVEFFHPRFIGLTGTANQIKIAASAFRVRYRFFKDKDGTQLMAHSGKIFFINTDGGVLAYYPHDAPAGWLVQSMSQHIQTQIENNSLEDIEP